MDSNLLKHFYQDGKFLKPQFIRLLRNKVIDMNTGAFLQQGFRFYDVCAQQFVTVPCDDCNFTQMLTFKNGLENGVLHFPFSLKCEQCSFIGLDDMKQFMAIFDKMVEYRAFVIKQGWAVKYRA